LARVTVINTVSGAGPESVAAVSDHREVRAGGHAVVRGPDAPFRRIDDVRLPRGIPIAVPAAASVGPGNRDSAVPAQALRDAAGDDMVLMLDNAGSRIATREDALRVGRAIEDLDYYWYEEPIPDYDVEGLIILREKLDIPICATAHTEKKLLEMGVEPASTYDIVEILNHLKDPAWQGVKGEGNHDLVLFFGIRTDMANQGLSVLKHYAPHLKTMTLCKYVFPNADYSLPNIRKDEKWKELLESLITNLKKEG